MKFKGLREALSSISPSLAHSLMYVNAMHALPNLKTPQTFNEKISWLKLYELPNNPLAVCVADKFAVREYVEKKGFADILPELYGSWSRVEDIDFNALPSSFVMKCNHGCGMNVFCPAKESFDVSSAVKSLSGWMMTDWALLSAEFHYGKIQKMIICEEFIRGLLSDFKFFCFAGEPKFFYVSRGLENGPTAGKVSFFDMNGEKAPFRRLDHEELDDDAVTELPGYFHEMVAVARELSEPFDFARIDFLSNGEEFYFSEVTLTPCAGMMPIDPPEWDLKLGKMINIGARKK